MAGPVVLGPEADIAGVVFALVVEAERVAARLRWSASLNQSCGPSRRSASIRIMAAPLPWFFTGGSTAKPASRK